MDDSRAEKKYEAFKIPDRRQTPGTGSPGAPRQANAALPDGMFYEIEYSASPFEGVGRFVLKSRKIDPPEKDDIRGIFYRMRDISRLSGSYYPRDLNIYDRNARRGVAEVFYKQAVFMKDFTDDYAGQAPFSSHFPRYQMMSYEQLRTYFTWRTRARNGDVGHTSLSYVLLYIYELLNNAGTDDPRDGMEKLMFLWNAYRGYDPSIDNYVLLWLKEYHIYYNLPQPFKSFAEEHNLAGYYPKMTDPEDSFGFYCSVSKYDIRKSAFFTDETSRLIADCLAFVIDRLRQEFENVGIRFDDAVFMPRQTARAWVPFSDAVFFDRMKQPDRRVTLSENEIYVCRNNKWTLSTAIPAESGRRFAGYVMKRMESILREFVKHKFKLSVNPNMLRRSHLLWRLKEANLSLDKIIAEAVADFYRDATKTVVTVDSASLARIRREALSTQEALTVEERADGDTRAPSPPEEKPVSRTDGDPAPVPPGSLPGGWESLKAALSPVELRALAAIARGGTDLKGFADGCGVMPEVLADGINEKAADCVGDNLLDEEMTVYADYEERVKRMVEAI
ncbi:MAG: TerB N-terminal domain-containing protein [Oscillospiraceae bacterium]|jgi:hypothetical protein|nr:TerB N-terminal domain-containing protein [Oscillospiraceae bacterium]